MPPRPLTLAPGWFIAVIRRTDSSRRRCRGVHAARAGSGNEAVALAVDQIRLGRADIVLAGGTEAAIHPLPMAAFAQNSPVGTWTTVDDNTGKPKSVVEIYGTRDGSLAGRVNQVLSSDRGPNPVCDNCSGERKGKPVEGMEVDIRGSDGTLLPERAIGKLYVRGASVMAGYFRDEEATRACLTDDGWLDTGDMGYLSGGYIFIVGRAKDMIIINGRNHWPQDIEWAVEQLPGFKSGDIAAFAITTAGGEETPAVLVHCRTSDGAERTRLREEIRERVRSITGMNCVIELVPPKTLPRTSSGKLSRAKARNLYLSGDIVPYDIAA